jgi:hypothetical protein
MKIQKILFLIVFFLAFIVNIFSATIYNEKKYYAKTALYLNTGLELDFVSNRLNDGWKNAKNETFYNDGTTDSTDVDNSLNSKLSFESYLNYSKNFKAMMAFDVYSSKNDTLWQPINDQNKKINDKQYISLKKTEINLKDYFYHIRYFKGISHYNWKYEGDLFDFYKEQFETDKYLNVSERTVPEGVEADYKFNSIGDLKVIYGEPIWGYKDSLYLKHNYKVGDFSNYFVYKYEKLPWKVIDADDQYKQSYAFTSKIENVMPFNLTLGLMYQPFRVNRQYDYLEDTSNGIFGNNYIKKVDTTNKSDALGYGLRVDYKDFLFCDYLSLESKYLDILAGNKQEYKISIDKILSKFIVDFKVNYRKPIIEANPLVYEGTNVNFGQAYISPKGENSPFWVDSDNRERLSSDVTISYFSNTLNPKLLYNYEIGNVESWNMNQDDNSNFLMAFNYNIQKYKGGTDSQYYFDENGNVVWETIGTAGLFDIKDPLSVYTLFLKGRCSSFFYYNFYAQYGDSISTGAYPYVSDVYTPITEYLDLNLKLNFKNYSVNLKYGQDCWGYEDWHRAFGLTYDNLYKMEIYRSLGFLGEIGFSYLNVFQDKYKTELIEIPSFEEFMIKWKYNFERVYILKNYEKDINKIKKKDIGNLDNKVLIKTRNGNILTVNNDGLNDVIVFDLDVKSTLDINSWVIEIFESKNNKKVYKKEGYGKVPSFFEWDGSSSLLNLGESLKDGQYYLKLFVKSASGQTIDSEKYVFDVYYYNSILSYDLLLKNLDNKNFLIKESYKNICFEYKLNSIYNLNNGKLNYIELENLLYILKNNSRVNKIKINVYVNFGKNIIEDRNIANKIGIDVSKYFIEKGIDYKLIDSLGMSLNDKNVNLDNSKDNILSIECSYI